MTPGEGSPWYFTEKTKGLFVDDSGGNMFEKRDCFHRKMARGRGL